MPPRVCMCDWFLSLRCTQIVREQRHTGEELKTDMLRGISEGV